MKISELKNAPEWLVSAKTENADVEIADSGWVIWKSGNFWGGDFLGGNFWVETSGWKLLGGNFWVETSGVETSGWKLPGWINDASL